MQKTWLMLTAAALTALASPAMADSRHGSRHDRWDHDDRWNRHDRWDRHSHGYRSHRGGDVHISLFGGSYGRSYYPAVYRPVVYQPVQVVEVPRYIPAPPPGPVYGAAYQTSNGQYCREYNSRAYIGSRMQEVYGTACLMPDGSWSLN